MTNVAKSPELTLTKVHVMGKGLDGKQRLIGTNFYKLFTYKEDLDSPVAKRWYAQNGLWFTGPNSVPVPEADVPEVVWEQCRDIEPIHRRMYRIVLPEERVKMPVEAERITGNMGEQVTLPSDDEWRNAFWRIPVDDDAFWHADASDKARYGTPKPDRLRSYLRPQELQRGLTNAIVREVIFRLNLVRPTVERELLDQAMG